MKKNINIFLEHIQTNNGIRDILIHQYFGVGFICPPQAFYT